MWLMWRRFWKAGEATRKPVWTLLQVTGWGTWAERQRRDREVEGRAGGGDEARTTAWTWVCGAVSTLGRWRLELGKEIKSVPRTVPDFDTATQHPTASSTAEHPA